MDFPVTAKYRDSDARTTMSTLRMFTPNIAAGAVLGGVDYVAPKVLMRGDKRSLKKSASIGVTMTAASVAGEYAYYYGLGAMSPMGRIPDLTATTVALVDGASFAGAEALFRPEQRSLKKGIRNILVGAGASAVARQAVLPMVLTAPSVNSGAAGAVIVGPMGTSTPGMAPGN